MRVNNIHIRAIFHHNFRIRSIRMFITICISCILPFLPAVIPIKTRHITRREVEKYYRFKNRLEWIFSSLESIR